MFDVIILGAGPAGLAAAVYFARQKVKFLVLTKDVGGYALWSSDVENYLGFHLLDGQELVKKFKEHLRDYQDSFELREQEPATSVQRKSQGGFRVITEKAEYEAKAILVATGTQHRKLNIPGEELYGKGLSYCAACDAPLFKDRKVYVVGGGNSAMDAALFAEKYSDQVILVTINPELKGDAAMLSQIQKSSRIQVYTSTRTTKIIGPDKVTAIRLLGPDGREREEEAGGILIEIGLQPISDMVDFVSKDRYGQIIVDKRNATDVEGVFAAGDVTDISEKQISVAVGEGSKAALEIIQWLRSQS